MRQPESLRRPSPATVFSLLALFISLSGVAWAATALERNSVKSKHIKDGKVRSVDVEDNGLTGTDIDEGTLSLQANPSSLPPNGPAGGDLAGTYPNPTIAGNAVGSGDVLDNSLTGDDVSESSLGPVPDADRLDGIESSSLVRVGRGGCGGTVTQTSDSSAASVCAPGIPVPALPSGHGVLKVDASVGIETGTTGCPCRFLARMHDVTDDLNLHGWEQPLTLGNSDLGQIALTGSVEPISGGTHTIQIRVWQVTGTSTATARTDFTHLFVPFNVNGNT